MEKTMKHTPALDLAALRSGTAALNELAHVKREWADLLAALETCYKRLAGKAPTTGLDDEAMDQARAAIAKAKGEASHV